MKKDKRWVVSVDGALAFRPDGVRGVGGVWTGAWRTGPHGIVAHGFLGAVWEPYERVGRFLTVAEAKAAVEQAWSARQ